MKNDNAPCGPVSVSVPETAVPSLTEPLPSKSSLGRALKWVKTQFTPSEHKKGTLKKNLPQTMMPLKEIERLRDNITNLQGQVEIKIFPPTGRDYYLLSYDRAKDVALYYKVTACSGDQRETIEEAWLSIVSDVVNTPGVSARVERWHLGKSNTLWFDTAQDKQALSQMTVRVIDILQKEQKGIIPQPAPY